MALLLDREFQEHELAEIHELDLRNISTKVWPVVLSRCIATELRLYNIKLPTLDGIETLTTTRRLTLEWANKIESLEPVFRLKGLTHLTIGDFPKLHRLDGIETLSELTELHLSGNSGGGASPLRLESIESVSRIPDLTTLSIANMKLDTDDITSLARCSNLRHLSLTNQFHRTQIAFPGFESNAKPCGTGFIREGGSPDDANAVNVPALSRMNSLPRGCGVQPRFESNAKPCGTGFIREGGSPDDANAVNVPALSRMNSLPWGCGVRPGFESNAKPCGTGFIREGGSPDDANAVNVPALSRMNSLPWGCGVRPGFESNAKPCGTGFIREGGSPDDANAVNVPALSRMNSRLHQQQLTHASGSRRLSPLA